mmetsp:Transcript_45160/g.54738  ORF Transcript_45160/g.54738 Transcript_45160/m.54738 type:complete len:142 (+) Transcript_45160:96-521(+)
MKENSQQYNGRFKWEKKVFCLTKDESSQLGRNGTGIGTVTEQCAQKSFVNNCATYQSSGCTTKLSSVKSSVGETVPSCEDDAVIFIDNPKVGLKNRSDVLLQIPNTVVITSWSCGVCTFLNEKPHAPVCEICGNRRQICSR